MLGKYLINGTNNAVFRGKYSHTWIKFIGMFANSGIIDFDENTFVFGQLFAQITAVFALNTVFFIQYRHILGGLIGIVGKYIHN